MFFPGNNEESEHNQRFKTFTVHLNFELSKRPRNTWSMLQEKYCAKNMNYRKYSILLFPPPHSNFSLPKKTTIQMKVYQMSENFFFLGKWLTVIFLSRQFCTPFRGRNIFTFLVKRLAFPAQSRIKFKFKKLTCSPTLIFLVRAPCGKTAWTWGTTVLLTTPPSGPMAWT